MRRLLVFLLLLLNSPLALAQDIYFGEASHSAILQAIWKPDGTQFATFAASASRPNHVAVEIWRDTDGLRLLTLDHFLLMVEPGQLFLDSRASISDVYWSNNGNTITTVAYTYNHERHVRQQLWSAATGELLVSYVIASQFSHGPRVELHHAIEGGDIVATWPNNQMSFIDIGLNSATLSQEVASIDFGDLSVYGDDYWNADSSQVLVSLNANWGESCPRCTSFYRLVDTDLDSETFGDTLWELEVTRETLGDSWYSAGDLFALHREGQIQAWDLNRKSPRFGAKVLGLDREFEFFHTLLFDESRRRIIIVEQNNMAFIEGAHPDAGPQCVERRCEYHISVWDVNGTSSTTNTRIMYLVHEYPYDGYGSRVVLNTASTQIHVHTIEKLVKGDESVWERDVNAYDLESLEPADPRDVLPDPDYQSTQDTAPQIDLSHLEDKSTRYRAIALHPAGTKLLARKFVGQDIMDSKASIVMIDPRTGEQLLPTSPSE